MSLDRHGRKVAVGAEGVVSTVGVALIKQIDDTGKQIDVLGQPVATTPIEHGVALVLGGIGGIDVVLIHMAQLKLGIPAFTWLIAPAGIASQRGAESIMLPSSIRSPRTASRVKSYLCTA